MRGKIPFRGAHEPWAFSLNLRNHFCGDLEGFGWVSGDSGAKESEGCDETGMRGWSRAVSFTG